MGASSLPGHANMANQLVLQKDLTQFSNKCDLLHVFPAAKLPQDFSNSLCGNVKGGTRKFVCETLHGF